MNWEFLLSFALAFGLLFVIFMTLGFYISYKRDKDIPKNQNSVDPRKGRYFKRFIPDSLKSKYENTSSRSEYLKEMKYYRKVTRAIVLIPIAIFLLALLLSWKKYGDYIYSPVRLVSSDLEKIKFVARSWTNEQSGQCPHIESLRKQFSERRFVVIGDGDSINLPEGIRSSIQRAESSFNDLGRMFNVPVVNCNWNKINSCAGKSRKNIYVVLPGKWDVTSLELLLKSSSRILFIGPPTQVLESSTGGWSWESLMFTRVEKSSGEFVIRGDQVATIGMDPGTLYQLPAIDAGVYVESSQAQAYRTRDDRKLSNRSSVSWAIGSKIGTKWMWVDFVPDLNSANSATAEASRILLGGIFRFLFDVEFEGIANWPAAMSGAALVVGDVIGEFEEVENMYENLGERPVRTSFFVVSKAAERNRRISKALSNWGEVHCIANEFMELLASDLKSQTLKLAECRKAVGVVVGATASGVHPPYENYNLNTLSAIFNSGFTFFISGLESQFSPVLLSNKNGEGRLVQIPRTSTAQATQNISGGNVLDLSVEVSNDMDWAKRLHGLYVFNFGDAALKEAGSERVQSVLQYISESTSESLESKSMWSATASDIDHWWRVRDNLSRGISVSAVELTRFEPRRIKVDKNGALALEIWNAKRKAGQ